MSKYRKAGKVYAFGWDQLHDTLEWHADNSKLNGTELRVLIKMVTGADYNTAEYCESQGVMASRMGVVRHAVTDAVARLCEVGAVKLLHRGSGQMPSTYGIVAKRTHTDTRPQFDDSPEYLAARDAYNSVTTTGLGLTGEPQEATTDDAAALVAGAPPIVAPAPRSEVSAAASSVVAKHAAARANRAWHKEFMALVRANSDPLAGFATAAAWKNNGHPEPAATRAEMEAWKNAPDSERLPEDYS